MPIMQHSTAAAAVLVAGMLVAMPSQRVTDILCGIMIGAAAAWCCLQHATAAATPVSATPVAAAPAAPR